jgi:hypothetical protein
MFHIPNCILIVEVHKAFSTFLVFLAIHLHCLLFQFFKDFLTSSKTRLYLQFRANSLKYLISDRQHILKGSKITAQLKRGVIAQLIAYLLTFSRVRGLNSGEDIMIFAWIIHVNSFNLLNGLQDVVDAFSL